MLCKSLLLFAFVFLAIFPIQQLYAQIYESLEEIKKNYIGAAFYHYKSQKEGYATLSYQFDFVTADGSTVKRPKTCYFVRFNGKEICYKWEVTVCTEEETERYQTAFEKHFTKQGWKTWNKNYIVSTVLFTIKYDYENDSYVISAQTQSSKDAEDYQKQKKKGGYSLYSPWLLGEGGEEGDIK